MLHMRSNGREPVNGDELKSATEAFAQELRGKIEREQGGVATFFNNFLLRTIRELGKLGKLGTVYSFFK